LIINHHVDKFFHKFNLSTSQSTIEYPKDA
jgi:hypothetical protein